MNLTSSKQKQAVYHLITYVMMSSGRITSNKGNYWKKVASFININDIDKSSAMSADINSSLAIIKELQENIAELLKKIAFALQIPPILEKLGPDKYKLIEKQYAL